MNGIHSPKFNLGLIQFAPTEQLCDYLDENCQRHDLYQPEFNSE